MPRTEAQKRHYENCKRIGKCSNCNGKTFIGKAKCSNCSFKELKERRAAGLCPGCGETPYVGKIRCGNCAAKKKQRYRNYKKKLTLDGRCWRCLRNQASPPLKICHDCALKARLKIYEDRLKIVKLYGGKCVCCEKTNPRCMQLDHIAEDGRTSQKR